ncbi:hypothetical protein QTG54_011745 [Skeletonema marinoi]|uniref:Uncharacterized protein n=1 Tax=Skeletonema marinoi TaxID=267567 RepID=A0AAD9D978_9STRA|nr:hypothetical protein QTG54_011745 [Skeletonema marinoi]
MLLLSLKQLHATAILLALASTGASNFVTAAAAADTVTTDQLDVRFPSSNPAPPGKNIDGTSVTTNFVRAYNEKQLFLLMPFALALFEKPASPALPASPFWWCSDFTFSNFTTDTNAPMGFVGRCVWTFKEGGSAVVAAGVQGYVDDPSERFSSTLGISAVYVDQTNVFEYEAHRNTENMVTRFWDDGRDKMPLNMWVTHDADRTEQTANALQVFGQFTWMSTEEAATFLNVTAGYLTPERFSSVYANVWSKEYASLTSKETSTMEEMTSTSDIDVDATDSDIVVDDDSSTDSAHSGSRRKLEMITTRLFSAALRLFGV